MKYILGLLAICFCLALSVDVGAVEQPIKTEFVQAQAPVFCESIEVDFAIRPTFIEATTLLPTSQPGVSHGNLRRLCGYSLEAVTTNYLSLQIEAPSFERYRPRTDMRSDSVPAKEPDDNCLSDWKAGWQVA